MHGQKPANADAVQEYTPSGSDAGAVPGITPRAWAAASLSRHGAPRLCL